MSAVDRLAIFHHIQKTAGASLRLVVKANHAPGELLESYGAPYDNGWYGLWWRSFSDGERDALRCVAGHTANHLMPALERPFKVFCLLRDPVDRVISLYHYLLQRNEYMKGQAPQPGRLSRGVVGEIERREWSIEDIYEHLGGGEPSDSPLHRKFWPFFNGQTRAVAMPHLPVRRLPYAEGSPPDADADYERVLEIMDRHYAVGVQDDLEESMRRFADEFGWADRFAARTNVTEGRPRRDDVPEHVRSMIRAYNRLDADLHERYASSFQHGPAAAGR